MRIDLAAAPRSLLFVPGDRAQALFPKALRSGADAVILDLEDAVLPEAREAARAEVVCALAAVAANGPNRAPVFVRTQAVGAAGFDGDVASALKAGADGLVLPKIDSPADLHMARMTIDAAGSWNPALIPILETPAGILSARAIAHADNAIVGLGFGGEDLRASLRAPRSADGRELAYARGAIVLAAVAEGRWVFDTVSVETTNSLVVEEEARQARALGFTGKFAIHPAQVAAIHRGFRPSLDEVRAAEQIVAAFEAGADAGRGVVAVDGQMVDAPVVDAVRLVLEQWRRGTSTDGEESTS
jgi:citrate lyase subunit beta/citryl-CoA lyase